MRVSRIAAVIFLAAQPVVFAGSGLVGSIDKPAPAAAVQTDPLKNSRRQDAGPVHLLIDKVTVEKTSFLISGQLIADEDTTIRMLSGHYNGGNGGFKCGATSMGGDPDLLCPAVSLGDAPEHHSPTISAIANRPYRFQLEIQSHEDSTQSLQELRIAIVTREGKAMAIFPNLSSDLSATSADMPATVAVRPAAPVPQHVNDEVVGGAVAPQIALVASAQPSVTQAMPSSVESDLEAMLAANSTASPQNTATIPASSTPAGDTTNTPVSPTGTISPAPTGQTTVAAPADSLAGVKGLLDVAAPFIPGGARPYTQIATQLMDPNAVTIQPVADAVAPNATDGIAWPQTGGVMIPQSLDAGQVAPVQIAASSMDTPAAQTAAAHLPAGAFTPALPVGPVVKSTVTTLPTADALVAGHLQNVQRAVSSNDWNTVNSELKQISVIQTRGINKTVVSPAMRANVSRVAPQALTLERLAKLPAARTPEDHISRALLEMQGTLFQLAQQDLNAVAQVTARLNPKQKQQLANAQGRLRQLQAAAH